MAAISHSALRELIADFGEPDEYFSEMIHAPSAVSGGGFEAWYFRANPSPEKLVWQITSPYPEAAAKAVPLLLRYGGFGIDLNMGCSAPQIVNTGAGFAWMIKPKLETANFVRQVKNTIIQYEKEFADFQGAEKKHIRLSVKLRLGETEEYSALYEFCKMLTSEGVELITLHPRTQRQKYSRPCKHEYTARLAEDLNIPVYANGDIDSKERFFKYSSIYKCAGWMIGRAAVQKPWIFSEINNSDSERRNIETSSRIKTETGKTAPHLKSIDLSETVNRFFLLLKTEQPKEFHITRAQRFFTYFCGNFTFAHHIKSKILNCKDIETMRYKLNEYFLEMPEDKTITTKV